MLTSIVCSMHPSVCPSVCGQEYDQDFGPIINNCTAQLPCIIMKNMRFKWKSHKCKTQQLFNWDLQLQLRNYHCRFCWTVTFV